MIYIKIVLQHCLDVILKLLMHYVSLGLVREMAWTEMVISLCLNKLVCDNAIIALDIHWAG